MLRKILLVTGKELRAAIRDPHVLVFLLFPLLVYPGTLIAVVSLATYQEGREEAATWQLSVEGPEDLLDALSDRADLHPGGIEALIAGDLDAVVLAHQDGDQLKVTVHHVSTEPRSASANIRIHERLRALSETRLKTLVERLELDADLVQPIEVERRPREGQGQLTRWFAAVLLSMVVPVAMLISGIYPAVELVVSERERGTLETTLITPIPRVALLTGKVLTCVLMMLGAGLANAGALVLTANQMVLMITGEFGSLWVPPVSSLAALPALAGLGVFLAGANILVVLPASSFKEGEYAASLLMTAMTGLILAGFIGLVANVGGDRWILVPGANTVVALHMALLGEIRLSWVVFPTLINGLTGGLFIALAGRVLEREDALFGGWLPRWLAPIRRILPK